MFEKCNMEENILNVKEFLRMKARQKGFRFDKNIADALGIKKSRYSEIISGKKGNINIVFFQKLCNTLALSGSEIKSLLEAMTKDDF